MKNRTRRKNKIQLFSTTKTQRTQRFFLLFVPLWFFFLLTCTASAQQPNNKAAQPANLGTISGQVFKGNGQPFADASILVRSVSGNNSRMTSTNNSGKFRVTKLAPGAYTVTASAPGYFAPPDAATGSSEPLYYRLGDSVTITLIKGSVITGKVLDPFGRPVVGARVRAIPARGAKNHTAGRDIPTPREWLTDDRGIYRIYGLEPGSYLAAASGSARHYRSATTAPTYYPSANRSGAAEVIVSPGEETSGVDIRYRSEQGRTISGTISGAIGSAPGEVSVELVHAPTGTVEATADFSGSDSRAFTFYGVMDGDYDLIARRLSVDGAASTPRKAVVKGADITGLELPLIQLGSITGQITIEAVKGTDSKAFCETKRLSLLEEIVITAHRDDKRDSTDCTPNEKGDFTLRNLDPGSYHVEARLPSENWYVRSITLNRAAANSSVTLKQGDRLTGLVVTIGEDAAGLRGKVVAAAEGERLPARLRVYLMPVEREQAENALRYREAEVRNGVFEFGNMAPGRYLVLARPEEKEADRSTLRREAAATNTIVELQSCLRITDFVLQFKK